MDYGVRGDSEDDPNVGREMTVLGIRASTSGFWGKLFSPSQNFPL